MTDKTLSDEELEVLVAEEYEYESDDDLVPSDLGEITEGSLEEGDSE
jgi:hypothetical protein